MGRKEDTGKEGIQISIYNCICMFWEEEEIDSKREGYQGTRGLQRNAYHDSHQVLPLDATDAY